MTARELGIVDDARIQGRFNALQRDVFYLTGTMQLVVLRRLLGGEFAQLTARLASSATGESGAISTALESALASRCAPAAATVN
jgi:hypothetical protein